MVGSAFIVITASYAPLPHGGLLFPPWGFILIREYKRGINKMEKQEDEKGFVESREKTITEVELLENKYNPEQIDKLIFHCSDGNITWKPRLTKSSYEGGFKVSKSVAMEKGLVPELVTKIAQLANEKGSIKVLVAYNYWVTMKDGEKVTYRFLNSAKTLEQWQIIPEDVTTEEVKADKP